MTDPTCSACQSDEQSGHRRCVVRENPEEKRLLQHSLSSRGRRVINGQGIMEGRGTYRCSRMAALLNHTHNNIWSSKKESSITG